MVSLKLKKAEKLRTVSALLRSQKLTFHSTMAPPSVIESDSDFA